MIVEIVEISAIQKKSEYALICLYFSTILFVLYHILLYIVCRCKITTFISFGKIYSHKVLLLISVCPISEGVEASAAISTPVLSVYIHYGKSVITLYLPYS